LKFAYDNVNIETMDLFEMSPGLGAISAIFMQSSIGSHHMQYHISIKCNMAGSTSEYLY